MNRRAFLKTAAAASAASAVGIAVPTSSLAAAKEIESNWKWDKAVCRFCGTGCGIMVATKDEQIV
ncbi:MAG: twin-arginine translocation signal domain-containing protein, partial [Helicobacter apodemus]|nr:twin-arginine translocation signal domain-containing protein [Helicobacter apodemus]